MTMTGVSGIQLRIGRAHAARACGVTSAVLLALTVAACGSSSAQPSAARSSPERSSPERSSAAQPSAERSSAALLGGAVQQNCTSVSDVLSDGPDPDADPVGYAQAQVLPLRQLKISDTALHRDVLALASAFQVFSGGSHPGGTPDALKVAKAENAVNSICPEAAP
jgi:hypothetical protein